MTDQITITLPLPAAALSPNARVHWRPKAVAIAAARAEAEIVARLAARRYGWAVAQDAVVRVVWHARTRRWPDDTNIRGWLKPYEDGLQGVLIADDNRLTWLPVERALDRDNPRVELTLYRGRLPTPPTPPYH